MLMGYQKFKTMFYSIDAFVSSLFVHSNIY